MEDRIKQAQSFAAAHAVEWLPGRATTPGSFETDPALDFGRLIRREPAYVLRPATVSALQATIRFLRDTAQPYKVRAAAHSPSGEVLIDGGVVVDLQRLNRTLGSDPSADTVQVEAGATWMSVIKRLALAGRAPLVVTDNPRTTVGGTLSYGGFGGSSHLYGLQIDNVVRVNLVLPDGELAELTPQDELFHYVLGGHGQLGVMAQATLRTSTRPWRLRCQLVHWSSRERFLAAAIQVIEQQSLGYLRARARVYPEYAVSALCGHFGATDPDITELGSVDASPVEHFDLLGQMRGDLLRPWPPFGPALEGVLPIPAGLAVWPALDAVAEALGPELLPSGYSVMVVRGKPETNSGGALAPLPVSDYALLVAVRPAPATLLAAHAVQAALRPLAQQIVAAGGRIYLASFPLPPEVIEAQLGSARAPLTEWKRRLDPAGLCNRGALLGWQS